jgi:predicted acetyltransferase
VLTRTDEVAAAAAVFRTAMVGLPIPSFGPDPGPFIEPGRSLGAFDADGQLVGGADAYTSWLTVPGGARVPHGAVTHVGVLPTHTRRGIVTALITRQLHDLAARGEVVASLRASEAVIYERFGYGIATWAADYELDRRHGALRPAVGGAASAGTSQVRLADPAASGKLLAEIYRQAAWTGAIDRPRYWWNLRRHIAEAGSGQRYLAVHGPEGGEDGYVSYHPVDTERWFGGQSRTVVVDDFIAHSQRAYLALVRYLATLDLIDVVRLPGRPADDPLPQLFADVRAVRVSGVRDETWLRLVDVEAALRARGYGPHAEPAVIWVTDRLLPANSGGYRVAADGVRRSDEDPGIELDVAALASAYLGATRFSTLALAGRATERRPGALAAADELFAVARAPFAGTGF